MLSERQQLLQRQPIVRNLHNRANTNKFFLKIFDPMSSVFLILIFLS